MCVRNSTKGRGPAPLCDAKLLSKRCHAREDGGDVMGERKLEDEGKRSGGVVVWVGEGCDGVRWRRESERLRELRE